MGEPKRSMRRYEIPVDDLTHTFALTGPPLRVAPVDGWSESLEFWAEHHADAKPVDRSFRVFGTGQEIPPGAAWVGTADRTKNGFVWHLYQIQEAS
jgi:hypothetical protein